MNWANFFTTVFCIFNAVFIFALFDVTLDHFTDPKSVRERSKSKRNWIIIGWVVVTLEVATIVGLS